MAWTIYTAVLGALVVLCLPARQASHARWIALAALLAGVGCAVGAAVGLDLTRLNTIQRLPWIRSLGIDYWLAVDGISLALVFLTGVAAVAGVLFSWNLDHRAREYYALYLLLIAGVYGVFLSFDAFLLFVFYELAIIPKYFLIAIWGSSQREYGAMKLVLYSFVGSALALIGLLAIFVGAGAHTMDLVALSRHPFPATFQQWVFPLVFIGFGVLAGLWPFHSWAPTGHVAAPTAVSMLLAGVVMKLGAYGALRLGVSLLPLGLQAWQLPLTLLAVTGIIYGGLVALVQKDFKFVIGYSSVSHMGFVLLGLLTLNFAGLTGAVMQMISHGIIAGLLFAVVGRMVYDRTHTRWLDELERLPLRQRMPFAAATLVVGGAASMGLPGFSGFVAELLVLVGAWAVFPGFALAAGAGLVIGVAYSLRAWQKTFFGDLALAEPEPAAAPWAPITVPERLGAWLLMAATMGLGLFPGPLIGWIEHGLRGELFDGLRRGGFL